MCVVWGACSTCRAADGPDSPTAVVHVDLGSSIIVKTPWPAKRVSITQTNIADVQVLSPSQVLVMGKAVGVTDLIAWNKNETAWQTRVEVGPNLSRTKESLEKLMPGSKLTLVQAGDMLVISGSLSRADQALQLRNYLAVSGLKNVDMTNVSGVQQVKLQVRVAEVSRTAMRTLGINAFFTGGDFFGGVTVGSSAGGPINPISIGVLSGTSAQSGTAFNFTSDASVSPAATLFGGAPHVPMEFFVQALSENRYLRVLAEPTLVALSGETASFLAGGEYPIPVVQGSSSGSTAISIEYKEFGVRLKFRPMVLGDGGIRLFVAPEVSELSQVGAVEIQGFSIPSIVTRKAETTLELKSGQTFCMAGLISRSADGTNSRVPGAGDLPVLGALFRSVRYQSGETEMLVLVTATLVEPLNSAPAVPGVTESVPTDWEVYALGNLTGKQPAKLSASDARWLQQAGILSLRGPGAWATYDQPGPANHYRLHRTSEATTQPGSGGAEKANK